MILYGRKVRVTGMESDVSSVWFSLTAHTREIVELGDCGPVAMVALARDETSSISNRHPVKMASASRALSFLDSCHPMKNKIGLPGFVFGGFP